MGKLWITKGSKKKVEVPRGVIAPPIAWDELIEAYYANPYHAACVDVKAINVLGNGLADEGITAELNEMAKDSAIFVLLQKTIRDIILFGNAFWETPPGEIYHIPAQTMFRNEQGWVQIVGKDRVQYSEDEIWHFKMDSLQSSFYGSISYASILPSIGLLATLGDYNRNFFKNNAIPDMAIITKGGVLSPAAESNIQRFMRAKFRGFENAHKVLYIPAPEGMEVKFEFLQRDRDMQFKALKDDSVAEILACHGVPPRLLGIQVAGKLGGAAESTGEMEIFYRTRIAPMQNIVGGFLDAYFRERLGKIVDIEFDSWDYNESAGDTVLRALRG